MTIQQLQSIIALAEEGTFSKAAAKLYVSQPAISQVIKRTEQQLDIALLDRNTKHMSLTEAGQAYYNAAKKIQATERELDAILSDIKQLKSGSVTIGTTPFRASCMLPRSLFLFKNQYPGIEIHTVFDSIHNLKEQMLDGRIDFCVERDLFEVDKFRMEPIASETYYLAVPENYEFNLKHEKSCLTRDDICTQSERLYDVEGIHLSECGDLPFLTMDVVEEAENILNKICEAEQFTPSVEHVAHNLEIMFHWIMAGYGAGLVPDTQIHFNSFGSHPKYYKIADPEGTYGVAQTQIVIAYKPRHYFSLASTQYLKDLKSLIEKGDWLLNANPKF